MPLPEWCNIFLLGLAITRNHQYVGVMVLPLSRGNKLRVKLMLMAAGSAFIKPFLFHNYGVRRLGESLVIVSFVRRPD
jgi:hypothetical protein